MKQTAVEWDALVKKNKMTTRIDVEEFNRNAKEVFENEVVPQIKKAKEDNMTAVEWLIEQWPILESQIPERILDQAKEMEKEQMMDAFVECWKANVPEGVECKLDAEQFYQDKMRDKITKAKSRLK